MRRTVIVSPGLAPVEADYVHDWRTERLSDHSGLWARLEPVRDRASA